MNTVFRKIFCQSLNNKVSRNNMVQLALKSFGSIPPSDSGSQVTVYTKESMKKMVKLSQVVVFMKGNPEQPRCGFSNAVVQILHMHGVPYIAHDVLQNDELRQSIKEFSEWPTIPQVFINGEFVGGCDILLQMHQNGELIEELKKAGINSVLLKEAKDDSKKNDKKKS